MVLGFNRKFIGPIMNGTKIHTIREDKNNRWKPANTIHMAVGVRTKNYTQFALHNCISVQTIEIRRFHGVALSFSTIKIGNNYIWQGDWLKIARNDGFETLEEFFDWFDKDFTGKIIHWTTLKY